MSTPDSFYEWGRTEKLTAENLTKRFRDLVNRLKPLEALEISWQAALTVVKGEVLARSESVIAGLRDQLVAITDLDWLTATSSSRVAFVEGGTASLVIDEQSRALFAPGPFAIVGRIGDPLSYAIVQTVAYDRRGSGQWDTTVVAVVGSLGTPQQDWAIGAVAGSTLVQIAFLNEAKGLQADIRTRAKAATDAAAQTGLDRIATGQDRTATGQDRTATGQDRTATGQDRTATGQDRKAVADGLAAIAGGPVYQVNGKAGNVTLGAHDVGAYTVAEMDGAFAALKGSADAAHDTLGELAALVDAATAAAAANAAAVSRLQFDTARALRAARIINARLFP